MAMIITIPFIKMALFLPPLEPSTPPRYYQPIQIQIQKFNSLLQPTLAVSIPSKPVREMYMDLRTSSATPSLSTFSSNHSLKHPNIRLFICFAFLLHFLGSLGDWVRRRRRRVTFDLLKVLPIKANPTHWALALGDYALKGGGLL